MIFTITLLLFLLKKEQPIIKIINIMSSLMRNSRIRRKDYRKDTTQNILQMIPSRSVRYQITEDFCKNILEGKVEEVKNIINEDLARITDTEVFMNMINITDVTVENFKPVLASICQKVFCNREPTIAHILVILTFGRKMGQKINQDDQSSRYIENTLSETVSIISVNMGFLKPQPYHMCLIL